MRIYFAGSIAGGRDYLETYRRIVRFLQDRGHEIPTEHIIKPDVLDWEKDYSAEEIYHRDVEWLRESDAMVAEVSNPSLGVGYEICYALNLKKPVLCLYHDSVFLSRMILGNKDPRLTVLSYQGEEWQNHLELFLKSLEL